jgi:hypothetical protein
MEKDNIAWLIIRALGIYIGFEAIIKLSSLFNMYIIYKAQADLHTLNETQLLIGLGYNAAIFLIYTLMSFYCLRKGGFLHILISFNDNDKNA